MCRFFVCNHILKIAFVIPLKNLGIFITTIFIVITSFYHLNKHSQPNNINKIVSITARTATGSRSPDTTPRQKARALSPTAFAQPLMQKFTIAPHPQIYLYHIICLYVKCVIIFLIFMYVYVRIKYRGGRDKKGGCLYGYVSNMDCCHCWFCSA